MSNAISIAVTHTSHDLDTAAVHITPEIQARILAPAIARMDELERRLAPVSVQPTDKPAAQDDDAAVHLLARLLSTYGINAAALPDFCVSPARAIITAIRRGELSLPDDTPQIRALMHTCKEWEAANKRLHADLATATKEAQLQRNGAAHWKAEHEKALGDLAAARAEIDEIEHAIPDDDDMRSTAECVAHAYDRNAKLEAERDTAEAEREREKAHTDRARREVDIIAKENGERQHLVAELSAQVATLMELLRDARPFIPAYVVNLNYQDERLRRSIVERIDAAIKEVKT